MPKQFSTSNLRSGVRVGPRRETTDVRPPTGRLAAWVQRGGVLLVSTILCFGMLELWARLLADVPQPLGRRHPVLGKTYQPGFRGAVFVAEAGRNVFLRMNREGFRGPDLPHAAPPGVRRLALLGDSFVAAIAVDEEETSAARLEGLLEASRGERWQVLNFGVSGASTAQQLVLYREVAADYRPEVVVTAYFTGNDFTDNSPELSSYPRVYFELDAEGDLVAQSLTSHRRWIAEWLNRHSRLYVWQKQALAALDDRIAVESGWQVYVEEPELEDVWELNARIIEELRDEVEARGAVFVLAVLPAAEEVYDDAWRRLQGELAERTDAVLDRHRPERRLRQIAERLDIPVVLMHEEFRRAAALEESDAEPLFIDRAHHFTAKGNLLAARILHRYLLEGAEGALLEPSPRTVAHHVP